MNSPRILHLTAALLLLAAGFRSEARTINWGGAVGDTLLTSNGVPLDSTFTFELGTFGIFVPSVSNLDQWGAHWKIFDRAVAPAIDGWDSGTGFFSGTATLEADGTSDASPPLPAFTFSEGEQAYIWVYNTLAVDSTTEWALVTNASTDGSALDDWTMPAHSAQVLQPLEWRLSNATGVPFGGLNDDEGPGDHAVTPPSFELQTHTVPEPSSALLAMLAGALGLMRRRR